MQRLVFAFFHEVYDAVHVEGGDGFLAGVGLQIGQGDVAILPLNNTSNGVRINDKKSDDKEGITFDNFRIHLTAMFPIWNKTVSDEPDVN